MSDYARCVSCGKFMSHDQILLGVGDGAGNYLHCECWEANLKKGMYSVTQEEVDALEGE